MKTDKVGLQHVDRHGHVQKQNKKTCLDLDILVFLVFTFKCLGLDIQDKYSEYLTDTHAKKNYRKYMKLN